jgi:Rrf2 family protein
MAGVLKISEAASLALHGMAYLAANPERPVPIGEISAHLHASEAHLSKVFQRLAHHALVRSVRGPGGGFVLAKAPNSIALLEVYEAIEGPLKSARCLLSTPVCEGKRCIFGDLLVRIDKEVKDHLSKTRLSELTDVFKVGKRKSRKRTREAVTYERRRG